MIKRLPKSARWALLISGRGSNLQVWLDHLGVVDLRWVVSSKLSAPGLLKARLRGVPTAVLPQKIDWKWLDQELRKRNITHVFLAGFMKLIPAEFVDQWAGRILNIHPSLLPAFPGLQAMEKAFEVRAPLGVSVHQVVAEMDAGPLIYQKQIGSSTSWPEVQRRATLAEHHLMREVIQKWS